MTIDPEIEWHLDNEWTEYSRVAIPSEHVVYGFHLHYIEQPSWCSCDIWSILVDTWRDFVNRTTYVDIEATLLGMLESEICAEIDAEIIGSLCDIISKQPEKPRKSWWCFNIDSFFHNKKKRMRY